LWYAFQSDTSVFLFYLTLVSTKSILPQLWQHDTDKPDL